MASTQYMLVFVTGFMMKILSFSSPRRQDGLTPLSSPPAPNAALLSENPDEPKKKPRGMKGRLSFKVLPFCPIVSLLVSFL